MTGFRRNFGEKPKRIIYLETDGCHIRTLEGWNECKTFVLFETRQCPIETKF